MKTISIQQPWASLICAGVKDVENRTWKPYGVPGRILIHASSRKVTKKFYDNIPLDWVIAIKNAITFGVIPDFDELETSAIIGYVTVTGFQNNTMSLWDGGEDQIKWTLADAYLFDKPICDVKGKLNLFDFPIDENHMPTAHKVNRVNPSLENGVAVFNVNHSIFEELSNGFKEFTFDFDDELWTMFINDDESVKTITEVKFINDGECLVLPLKNAGFYEYLNDDGRPIVEPNLRGEDLAWLYMKFEF